MIIGSPLLNHRQLIQQYWKEVGMRRLADYSALFTVVGDGEFSMTGPHDATIANVLTFAESDRYLSLAAANENISAILVPPGLADRALNLGLAVACSDKARESFFLAHNSMASEIADQHESASVAIDAIVAPTAILSNGVVVDPRACISSFAFVGPGCRVGEGAFVGEGALIGVDGHFEQHCNGRRMRVHHTGTVEIGPGAQVLAGAIVQRDVFGFKTIVGEDAVIGPGVRVAHGAKIGRNAVLAGGSLVAGYAVIEDNVWIGPSSTIGNKLTVGESARVEIGSVVIESVPKGAHVSGNYAISHTANLRRWRSTAIPSK